MVDEVKKRRRTVLEKEYDIDKNRSMKDENEERK